MVGLCHGQLGDFLSFGILGQVGRFATAGLGDRERRLG